ncbi:MAG: hypothetical protein JW728_01015 [Candidatus Aureabacteria bacterium]|nr:hypothetical protein [Candidatus Auribacterota bacterium]
MRKVIQMLGRNSFALFLFVLLLAVLNWPILSSLNNMTCGGAYIYICAVWLTIVVLALLVGLSLAGSSHPGEDKKGGEDGNV